MVPRDERNTASETWTKTNGSAETAHPLHCSGHSELAMVKRFTLAFLVLTVTMPGAMARMRGFSGPVRLGPGFGRGVTFVARNHPLGSRGFYLGDTPFYYT